MTAVGKEMVRDARYLALATRIAAEMGAHIVKTYYVEDDFERITSTCGVPVVMAGGKKLPEREALQMTYNAIARGASGVDMGRNIFQSDCPLGMIKAVNAVVHGNASVDDAYAVYEDEKSASGTSAAAGRARPTTPARSSRDADPESMRAAVYYNNSDVRIEELPVPEIGPGETLVHIRASGICGSDVLEWYRVPKAPIVLGHEVAGDVVAVGDGRDATWPWATASWSRTTCRAVPADTVSRTTTRPATRFTPPTSIRAGSPSTCACPRCRPTAASS